MTIITCPICHYAYGVYHGHCPVCAAAILGRTIYNSLTGRRMVSGLSWRVRIQDEGEGPCYSSRHSFRTTTHVHAGHE